MMIDEFWGESDIVLFIYLFVLILDSICADFPQTFFLFLYSGTRIILQSGSSDILNLVPSFIYCILHGFSDNTG